MARSEALLDELVRKEIVEAGAAPAAAVAIAARSAEGWQIACGAAGARSPSLPDGIDVTTPFDLASVSKPFFAAALARLASRRVLDLGAPLIAFLPELSACASANATLESLLAHRAGLAAHLPLFAPLLERRAFAREVALLRAARARDPALAAAGGGFAPLYSDLGYILAGAAVSRALGVPLDHLVREQVSIPLGLAAYSARQYYAADPHFGARVAPTEVVPWRGGELVGVVHDENAWALSGHDLSGHAGLFAAAEPVARFGAAMIDALKGRSSWLEPTAAEFLTGERPGGSLRAGFDGKSALGSSAGSRAGQRTFGHLGYTGTSFWCDPDAELVVVLLTNRVRFGRENTAIRELRPRLHDALFALAAAATDALVPLARSPGPGR